MTREEKVKNLLTELIDMIDNGSQRDLDRADEIGASIIKLFEQKPKWILCSEKFPKEHLCDDGYVEPSDYVLVWGDHRDYGVSRYWGNRRSKSESPNTHKDWVDLDWVVQKPIAWMFLPEPYEKMIIDI